MILPDKVYDILKWVTIVALPAVGTLYFALSGIWGFPYGEQIVGTITAVVTFLGVLLGISTVNYNRSQAQRDVMDFVGDIEEAFNANFEADEGVDADE